MKKIYLISVFLVIAVAYGYSQTYYYKTVAKIDKDGVKSKPESNTFKGRYVTFNDNKSICYISDEKGYKYKYDYGSYGGGGISYAENFYFRKTQNGTNVYESKELRTRTENIPYPPFMKTTTEEVWSGSFYYFSSDFSKWIWDTGSGWSWEHIRTNGPDDGDDDIPTF